MKKTLKVIAATVLMLVCIMVSICFFAAADVAAECNFTAWVGCCVVVMLGICGACMFACIIGEQMRIDRANREIENIYKSYCHEKAI